MKTNTQRDKLYTVTLTGHQLGLISDACDAISRAGIGQFRDALNHMPTKETSPTGYHEAMDDIGKILAPFMFHQVDGWRSSLGIMSEDVKPRYRELFDIHQSIRHQLCWDRVREREAIGETVSTFGVSFDEPWSTSDLPLIKISKVEDSNDV